MKQGRVHKYNTRARVTMDFNVQFTRLIKSVMNVTYVKITTKKIKITDFK